MIMEDQSSLYELTTSRNGLTVPVIKGVHLHSVYNPSKEAEAFAKGFQESINKKSNILVLGLGFGYHIEEIAKIASKAHEEYRIWVIEPNERLVEDFKKKRNFEDTNITIVCMSDINDLYEQKSFIDLLVHKPCIIKHDASFNLEKEYFKKLLTYTAPEQISNYIHLIDNQQYSDYLSTYQDGTFNDLVNNIVSNGRVNDKKDFAMLALMTVFNDMNDSQISRGQQ
jgi:hypothetical protein